MNQFANFNLDARAPMQRFQTMKFGTQFTISGVRFRLWAPNCEHVALHIESEPPRRLPMQKLARGWFQCEVDGITAGTLYGFVLPDGKVVPDPASRFQPHDVTGLSEVIDPRSYVWSDEGWPGRPWEEAIIYELHIGTFTPEGTYRAAIERLDDLVDLGITTVELMPVADFEGRWNWGYDGALLFAPDSVYGRPDDLKAFVDAAHARRLTVILDVVYNHFGPSGNYMSSYAPQLTDKYETPWGPAVNVDDDGSAMIRDFIMANGRYWLNEYHFDGLRFDAVHEIIDHGPHHVLSELAEQLRASTDGRLIHLVAENCANQAGWLKREDDQRIRLYTAQWSDDIHHSLHALATGESFTYYADFAGRWDLAGRALAEGLGYQGEKLQHQRTPRGEPSAYLPATAFVSFTQNHDHVGNRPHGERIHQLASRQAARSLAAINLLSPHIPLLLMGEEWAASSPFLYFCDLGDDLAEAIRKGQKEQNKEFPKTGSQPPDPMAETTFQMCKLDWDERSKPPHADWLDLYRRLIAIRQQEIVPRLFGMEGFTGRYELLDHRAVKVWWELGDGSTLTMFANLSNEPLERVNVWEGRHLWLEGHATGSTLEAWGVVVSIDDQEAPVADRR